MTEARAHKETINKVINSYSTNKIAKNRQPSKSYLSMQNGNTDSSKFEILLWWRRPYMQTK